MMRRRRQSGEAFGEVRGGGETRLDGLRRLRGLNRGQRR
jgi:hypothetical protein